MISLKAPAKLNLVLEILGRRADGYHSVTGIMQTVNLCDELSYEQADFLTMNCDVPDLQSNDNMVLKAGRLLQQKCRYSKGATINLKKNIYWEAGLGGGSSDAAATLVALNNLWKLGCSKADLIKMAAELGSDVPFFIEGGTCMAVGRGEQITALPDIQQVWFVLLIPWVKPPPEKTAAMYKMISKDLYTDGRLTADTRAIIEAGDALEGRDTFNAFDSVAFAAYPGLESYWKIFKNLGAGSIHLAGSGPVTFTFFNNKEQAEALTAELKNLKLRAMLVEPLNRGALGY